MRTLAILLALAAGAAAPSQANDTKHAEPGHDPKPAGTAHPTPPKAGKTASHSAAKAGGAQGHAVPAKPAATPDQSAPQAAAHPDAHPSDGHAATPSSPEEAAAAPAKPLSPLPGYAPDLANQPMITSAAGWAVVPRTKSWNALATAKSGARQHVRWDYARSLIGEGLGSEAIGVLDVMLEDDDDLRLVPVFSLARGVALAQLGRARESLAILGAPELALNPEACAWRMRMYEAIGNDRAAIGEVNCALPAINARAPAARREFVLAAARVANELGSHGLAMTWLRQIPDGDPAANVERGRAYLGLDETQAARLRFDRVAKPGNAEERIEAKLGLIETALKNGRLKPAAALSQLDQLRYGWRGGRVERRALEIGYRLARDLHDVPQMLRNGATLVRYFNNAPEVPGMLVELQAALGAMLVDRDKMPIARAAGLYWDYRDLAPVGAVGDLLVTQLADRLAGAGLYARAAELMQYQLNERAVDVAKGPLSVNVATLLILAGQPDRALDALRTSEGPDYPQSMLWDRKRIEAVALNQQGKTEAALAALDGIPDARLARAEIYWQQRQWSALASEIEPALPPPGALSDVGQAIVLRQAVALAMIGREDRLQALRQRYAAAFSRLKSGGAFDVLTRAAGSIDPAQISNAMAAIPSASPAGRIGDLLDSAPRA